MAVRRDAQYALIMVGLQNDFVAREGFFQRGGLLDVPDSERSRVIGNVNTVAAVAREAEWPVVQACWQLRPDHLDASYSVQWRRFGLREAGALVSGSWGAQLTSELVVGPDDFHLPITSHSAFQFTHLDRILRNCGVTDCLLVGGSASGSVEDTARQGAAYGYRILFVADAIYPDDVAHLKLLANRGDIVWTSDALALARSGSVPDLSPTGS